MASKNREHLIFNPKPTMDETSGPGNAIASSALYKLGLILGESKFRDASLNSLRWARTIIEYNPASHCAFIASLLESTRIKYVVVFRGPDEGRRSLLRTCNGNVFESCSTILPAVCSKGFQSRPRAFKLALGPEPPPGLASVWGPGPDLERFSKPPKGLSTNFECICVQCSFKPQRKFSMVCVVHCIA